MVVVVTALLLTTPATVAARHADSLVGKHDLAGGGKRFRLDSVGLVRAAYLEAGIDVFAAPAQIANDRTGVDVVYQYAALHGRFHLRRRPSVGDLCFFGKTRDADGDGALDAISHVGIVTAVAADGTASVATTGKSRVVTVMLNRYRPKETVDEAGQVLNGRLFVGREPVLTSALFYTFATLD